MGRWYTNDDDGRIFNTARKLLGWTCIPAEATNIIDEHNADCDAYESRIAELEAQCVAERQQAAAHYQARLAAEAELAAVKAESLRVVKVGEPVDIGLIILGQLGFQQKNYLWRNGIGYNEGLGVRSVCDHHYMDISEDETAQPVELKPWESSNGD